MSSIKKNKRYLIHDPSRISIDPRMDRFCRINNTFDCSFNRNHHNGGCCIWRYFVHLIMLANQIFVKIVQRSSSETSTAEISVMPGTVDVPHGGTGVNTIPAGHVVVGNDEDAIIATKAAPSGDFVGTTDTQSLTNKTLVSPTITGALSLTTPLGVSSGGTGVNNLTLGNVLVGNNTSGVTATKAAPSGDFVGTTDTQTISNKTLTSTTSIQFVGDTEALSSYKNPTLGGTITFQTGPWATIPVSITIEYVIVGKYCVLQIPAYTNTADGSGSISSFTSDVIGVALSPVTDMTGKIQCITNSAPQFGAYTLTRGGGSGGTLTISLESGVFANSGNNGFDGFSISFVLR